MCISLFKLPEGTWVKAGSQSQWAEYQLDSEIKAPCMTVVNAWWNSRTPTCKLVQLIIKHLWSAITDWRDEASWVSAVQVHTHWAQFRCTETAVSFYLIIFFYSSLYTWINRWDRQDELSMGQVTPVLVNNANSSNQSHHNVCEKVLIDSADLYCHL